MPVLLGTDVGTYSCARMFHEQFGCTSVTISGQGRGPINDSAILDNVFLGVGGTLDHQKMIDAMLAIAADHPDRVPILMAFNDRDIDLVLNNRDKLEDAGYIIPLADTEAVERANSKIEVNKACERLGFAVPETVEIDPTDGRGIWESQLSHLTFPIVIKPKDGGTQFGQKLFAGHKKVYDANNVGEALDIFQLIADNGFTGIMLAQDMIVGDDTASWIVTGFVNKAGTVTAIATGRQILGLHTAGFIGNAGIIYTTDNPQLRDMAEAMLGELGLRGLFAIDIKIDARSGVPYLIDVNPRWGRGSYFGVVGGLNLARDIVADFVDDVEVAPMVADRDGIYAFVPPTTIFRWVTDSDLRRDLVRVWRKRKPVHPLAYAADRNPKRLLYRRLADVNQVKSLYQSYPKPTPTGF